MAEEMSCRPAWPLVSEMAGAALPTLRSHLSAPGTCSNDSLTSQGDRYEDVCGNFPCAGVCVGGPGGGASLGGWTVKHSRSKLWAPAAARGSLFTQTWEPWKQCWAEKARRGMRSTIGTHPHEVKREAHTSGVLQVLLRTQTRENGWLLRETQSRGRR